MGRSNLLHALKHLYAALGLTCFRGFVAKSVDIALHVLDLLLLPDVHRLLLRKLLGTQRFELTVIAGEQIDRFVLDMRDTRADLIEKVAIM